MLNFYCDDVMAHRNGSASFTQQNLEICIFSICLFWISVCLHYFSKSKSNIVIEVNDWFHILFYFIFLFEINVSLMIILFIMWAESIETNCSLNSFECNSNTECAVFGCVWTSNQIESKTINFSTLFEVFMGQPIKQQHQPIVMKNCI